MFSEKKNICILTYSLGKGGAEKVVANQSKMLTDLGYNVFIVTVVNDIHYDFSGELLNLGVLKDHKDGFLQRVYRLKTLQKYLSEKKIHLLIDHRSRESFVREFLLKQFLHKKIKTIFVVHNNKLEKYFPKSKVLAHLLYKNQTLVSVSKEIQKNIKTLYNLQNTTTIYNAISPINVEEQPITNPYILFFGRFDEASKDLSFLVKAYHQSVLPKNNIVLFLMGDGKDKPLIKDLIVKLELEKFVLFKPYQPNPYPIVTQAMFTVLTSNYEGFPMSIIESLACKTPVVSVDCESGPKEVLINNFNGLLVKKDLNNYTQALNQMSTNNKLRITCKNNCLKSIEHLSPSHIKKEWQQLINSCLS